MRRRQTSGSGNGFKPRGLSLRSKLVVEFGAVIVGIMALVIAVSIFGVPFTGYTGTLGYEKSKVLNTLGLIADLKKERFELWMGERKDDVTLFSESINISTSLIDLLAQIQRVSPDGKLPDQFWTQLTRDPGYELLAQRFSQIMAAYKAYQKIQIADAASGIILASSDEKELGFNVSGNPSFDKALKSTREVVVDIQLDPATTRPYLVVSRAIFRPDLKDTPTDSPLGVAMFYIDADAYLKPLLQTGTGMGATGDIVLVDQDSTILMSLKFPLPDGTIPKPLEAKIQALPALMAARGQEGVTIADDYRGVRVLSAVRGLTIGPDQNWGLVVKRDEAEVFGPLWRGVLYTCLVGFLGLLIAILLVVLVANRISGPIKDLSRSAREVEAGNLEVRAQVKAADEIGALAGTFNSMLESLKERSAEIERTNKELEAFSYSVSHDLRAPLRSIDGFSQALLEDYYENVDETGRDYLSRVRASTQHMGRLIDDLLKLSRLTRTEMRQEPVSLSGIATKIIDSLKKNEPDRSVECVVEEGITVNGDPYLIEIAMENLLNNAWKFTGKTPGPRIQFGMTQKDGLDVYYIKDNGAGFDMTYSDKLFGAFQRLHSSEEFSGTGIGLVTVQRIIHRHGGRIWAEAEPNKGATFFFTI
jgi:signal transduction histidine kinase